MPLLSIGSNLHRSLPKRGNRVWREQHGKPARQLLSCSAGGRYGLHVRGAPTRDLLEPAFEVQHKGW